MLNTAQRISEASLARLHPRLIDSPAQIRDILERVRAEGIELRSGVNRALERETAQVLALEADAVRLSVQHLDRVQRNRILLSLSLDGRTYAMSAPILEVSNDSVRIGLPSRLYVSERRDRLRWSPESAVARPSRLALGAAGRRPVEAEVLDYSHDGVGVRVPAGCVLPERLLATPLDGPEAGRTLHATVRNYIEVGGGWRRLGLSLRAVTPGAPIKVERTVAPRAPTRLAQRCRTLVANTKATSHRVWRRIARNRAALPVEILDFTNARGEPIRGIVDRVGDAPGAPVVLIPSAFAKTKETLLPLARTIVDTFAAAGESVFVIRTDGIRRRGESHNDPGCESRGRELHRFTYSQGVSDIHAALAMLRSDSRFRTKRVVLVTFSSGSIEARRALAEDRTGIVAGWISVVGAADLKSGWQVLSGGVDYIGGYERGVRFGIQKVLGVEGNIDLIAEDALKHGLAYMEDARRDMARIVTPIMWLRGRYDAWIDPERVHELMSCGDISRRRIVEVATGHQLRTSSEAFATFRLVAQEAGRHLLGRTLKPATPDLVDLDLRRQAELARLPRLDVDLAEFWGGYLLGDHDHLGMEILIETAPYREFLARQVQALDLRPGDCIADIGSGTGSLLDCLARAPTSGLTVHELDFVAAALGRARGRFRESQAKSEWLRAEFVRINLNANGAAIPLATGSYDRVVASLVLNYVTDPEYLLSECHRVLRPGGRLVVATLRPDADVSRICEEASGELRAGLGHERFALAPAQLDASISHFLNQVGRLLDLEEVGIFRTWSTDELTRLIRRTGFADIRAEAVFGNPPQAILVSAARGSH